MQLVQPVWPNAAIFRVVGRIGTAGTVNGRPKKNESNPCDGQSLHGAGCLLSLKKEFYRLDDDHPRCRAAKPTHEPIFPLQTRIVAAKGAALTHFLACPQVTRKESSRHNEAFAIPKELARQLSGVSPGNALTPLKN